MSPEDDDGLVRLQKLLAQSGVASRRRCEELMLAGLVEVDGEVVTRLGTKVDPRTAVIRVEGKRLPPVSPHVYLVLNKPRGVVSTMSDPEGRRTLSDYVEDRPERLFHVGRLDTDTEGLILLTNDGDFAQRVAHPSYELDKTYVAEVEGQVSKATVRRLLAGVTLEDGPVEVSRGQGRLHPARALHRRAGHPRGPQPDRPPSPRRGRPPGPQAHPHRDRPRRAARAAVRAAARAHPRGARHPAGRRPALNPDSSALLRPSHEAWARTNRGGPGTRVERDDEEGYDVAVRAVRGATQLDDDVREHMLERVAEMVTDVMEANGLEVDDFISVIFTATSDLVSEFPAYAARRLGFGDVPLICARELEIEGSMPRVVRMLAHVDTDLPKSDITHVYLHGAAQLRRDLTRVREVPDAEL